MSDADNQMGGSGGETGRRPGGPAPSGPAEEAASGQAPRPSGRPGPKDGDAVDEESEESFPASDPPANY